MTIHYATRSSPDESILAALEHPHGAGISRQIIIADLTTDPMELRELPLKETARFPDVFWIDNQRFLVSGDEYYPGGAPLFTRDLNQIASIPG